MEDSGVRRRSGVWRWVREVSRGPAHRAAGLLGPMQSPKQRSDVIGFKRLSGFLSVAGRTDFGGTDRSRRPAKGGSRRWGEVVRVYTYSGFHMELADWLRARL